MEFSGRRVVVIGAGHMGTAIIAGLVKNGGDLSPVVVETGDRVRGRGGVPAGPGGTTEQGILHYREKHLKEILFEGLTRAAAPVA